MFKFKIMDAEGSGFNHSELGDLRRAGIVEAGRIWEEALVITVPIIISVKFGEMPRPRTAAFASTSQYYTEFGGSVQNRTVGYSAALASQLAGFSCHPTTGKDAIYDDLDLVNTHGRVVVDQSRDDPSLHPGGIGMFYYGHEPSEILHVGGIDFVNTMLHEIGHVLGFLSRLSRVDGSFAGDRRVWSPGAPVFLTQFDANLSDALGYDALMRVPNNIWNAYRKSVISSNRVCWGHGFAYNVAGKILGENSPALLAGEGFHEYPFIRLANGLDNQPGDNVTFEEGVGHLLDSYEQCLMDPTIVSLELKRELDIAPPMLHDMRWPIDTDPDIFVNPMSLDFGDVEHGNSMTLPVTISNLGSDALIGSMSIEQSEKFPWYSFSTGFDPNFELEQYWERKNVLITTRPEHSVGSTYHAHSISGKLIITTTNDPDEQITKVPLSSSFPLEDADGDAICDHNETTTPNGSKSLTNPFDPEDPNSTGDNGVSGADGILDGFNDFDGDGISNMAEFDMGFDPLDPNDFPTLDDTDGDGLSDYDELRDLDFSTEGIQNPFDPWRSDADGDGTIEGEEDYDGDGIPNAVELAHPTIFDVIQEDVTGDDGSLEPDTVLDGENDFDDDGISNEDEVRYGLEIVVYTAIGDIEWQLCVDE